jgi:hypothetical protein
MHYVNTDKSFDLSGDLSGILSVILSGGYIVAVIFKANFHEILTETDNILGVGLQELFVPQSGARLSHQFAPRNGGIISASLVTRSSKFFCIRFRKGGRWS